MFQLQVGTSLDPEPYGGSRDSFLLFLSLSVHFCWSPFHSGSPTTFLFDLLRRRRCSPASSDSPVLLHPTPAVQISSTKTRWVPTTLSGD